MTKKKNKPTCASLQRELDDLRIILFELKATKRKHLDYHRELRSFFLTTSKLIEGLENRLYLIESRARKDGELDYKIDNVQDTARIERKILRTSIGDVADNYREFTKNVMKTHLNEEHQKPTEEEKLLDKLRKVEPEFNSALRLYEDLSIESKKEEDKKTYKSFYDLLCKITFVMNDLSAYLHRQKDKCSDDFNFAEEP